MAFPPPLPPPDESVPTEPGLGAPNAAIYALQQRLKRVVAERDAAIKAVMDGSLPPKRTTLQLGLSAAQVTLVGSLIAVLLPIIKAKWPAYASVVEWFQQAAGLQ